MSSEESPSSPGKEWKHAEPEMLGLDRKRLMEAGRWQASAAENTPYRVLIVRRGQIVAEWNFRIDQLARAGQASASKSTFSCVLGVAVQEGVIRSADDRVADYYPELMDVAPGQGPKPGRRAYPDNEGITFRQLIGNTSGYMKPDEKPGKVFNYQTFGMNILTHAVASAYSLYKASDPERGAGFGTLTEWKVRNPIGGTWSWEYRNFELPQEARLGIFGYFTGYEMTPRDMARCGLLWMRLGRWNGSEVVPEEWMRQATRVNDDVLANEPEENHRYGLGFWCNDRGRMWPDLPLDSFAASGNGQQHIWVCPSLDLIVVRSPGIYDQADPSQGGRLLAMVADAAR
jgi:CubicO group peptidase (beta-lactamase class C family)